jgi:phage tail-like protein
LNPPLGFRFAVVFLMNGIIPNPIDIRFKSVSGINAKMIMEDVDESAATTEVIKVPKKVEYGELTMERGVLIGSPLSMAIEYVFHEMTIIPVDIIVSVLNEAFIPVKNWVFFSAYPVSWDISGIDANAGDVLIEKITFEYTRFKTLSL